MKKKYINPEIVIVELKMQGLLAVSRLESIQDESTELDLEYEEEGFDDDEEDV